MEELKNLLGAFSIGEILVCVIMIALAAKGIITFYDWIKARIKTMFNKEHETLTEKEKINERFDKNEKAMEQVFENQEKITNNIQELSDKIDMLVNSDREDIKSFLTQQHHFFCKQGWIDDYSLECCVRRYEYYTKEGGNSFIADFMKDLRRLPKTPPNDSSPRKELENR